MKIVRIREDIDKFDIKILSALNVDGRITKTQLSAKVFLSATPCWERMKKLERSGIIRGYHADIDIRSLTGVYYSRVEVVIEQFTISKGTIFEKLIHTMPQVIECESVLGNVDYILKVASRNIEEYQKTIEKIHAECSVQLSHKTYQISKTVKESRQVDIHQLCVSLMTEEIDPCYYSDEHNKNNVR